MNNYASIGFWPGSKEDFLDLVNQLLDDGKVYKFEKGAYVSYPDKSGAELWFPLDDEENWLAVNPHFKGQSKRRVGLNNPYQETDYFCFRAWAEPYDSNYLYDGAYPFLFEVPDGKKFEDIKLPQEVYIQLSAFAQQVSIYENEADFNALNSEIDFSSKSFIPLGLFNLGQNAPQAYAKFSGIIKQVKKIENKTTNNFFYWLLVDTFGGEVDVVADLSFFEKDPIVNNIISGNFWLSGQILGNVQ